MISKNQGHDRRHTAVAAGITDRQGTREATFLVDCLIIAGWTARDTVATEHHIAELEALGVARPAETPTFYRVAHHRLSQSPVIEVTGEATSGEVEFVLLHCDGALYVGIGSDHTDRQLETVGVTVSKQVCDKPIGREFWPLEEVLDHWDQLVARAHVVIDGQRHLYQEGRLAALLPPHELMARYDGATGLPPQSAMFGGTLSAIGGVRAAEAFEGEIEDPLLNRTLSLRYDIELLPVRG